MNTLQRLDELRSCSSYPGSVFPNLFSGFRRPGEKTINQLAVRFNDILNMRSSFDDSLKNVLISGTPGYCKRHPGVVSPVGSH